MVKRFLKVMKLIGVRVRLQKSRTISMVPQALMSAPPAKAPGPHIPKGWTVVNTDAQCAGGTDQKAELT